MKHGGHGHFLRRKIELAASQIVPASDAFWDHPRLNELFPKFLVAIYGSVRATVHLMEAANERACQQADTDRVSAALTEYFPGHIAEEREHDEWLLQDLEAIGFARLDVRQQVAPPAIAAMVGAQYYWIHHAHPVALLGFFAVLEGHPPTAQHLSAIQTRTHLPSEAFRMLQHHAVHDESHAAALYALLDTLPLSTFHAQLTGLSALHTFAMLKLLFDGLTASLDWANNVA